MVYNLLTFIYSRGKCLSANIARSSYSSISCLMSMRHIVVFVYPNRLYSSSFKSVMTIFADVRDND